MISLENLSADFFEKDGIIFSKKENKVSYPEHGSDNFFEIEDHSFWFSHRNNCIIESVLKYCPDNLFYDIGGGNGFVSKGLEEKGVSTVLIEPTVQGCLNAKRRKLKTIICSTLENAGIPKNAIPSIGLFDVVEHIEHDVDFLKTIHSYLQKSGFVFITVPAFNALWSNEDNDDGHFRRYTLKKLENKLRQAGLDIRYSTYFFSILPIPIFFMRTIPSKLGWNNHSNDLQKHKREHKTKGSFYDKMLKGIWNYELNKIKRSKKIPFGGSCLVVAQKLT